MSDACIFPEMLEAGLLAAAEAKESELTPSQAVIEIYLAMEGMRQIVMMRMGSTVH